MRWWKCPHKSWWNGQLIPLFSLFKPPCGAPILTVFNSYHETKQNKKRFRQSWEKRQAWCNKTFMALNRVHTHNLALILVSGFYCRQHRWQLAWTQLWSWSYLAEMIVQCRFLPIISCGNFILLISFWPLKHQIWHTFRFPT